MIAMDCGIDVSSINFNAALDVTWQSILELADSKLLVSSIVERAKEDYPINLQLRDYGGCGSLIVGTEIDRDNGIGGCAAL